MDWLKIVIQPPERLLLVLLIAIGGSTLSYYGMPWRMDGQQQISREVWRVGGQLDELMTQLARISGTLDALRQQEDATADTLNALAAGQAQDEQARARDEAIIRRQEEWIDQQRNNADPDKSGNAGRNGKWTTRRPR